jgi:hypothetical protein
LERAVEKMQSNLDYYTKNMKDLTEFSGRYKGLDRAAEIAQTMLT